MIPLLIIGCGSSDSPQGAKTGDTIDKSVTDFSMEINKLLDEVSTKAKSSQADFASMFTQPATAPPNAEYQKFHFSLGQLPMAPTGDTTELFVDAEAPNAGAPLTDRWKLAKKDGAWKLESAPIPKLMQRNNNRADRD